MTLSGSQSGTTSTDVNGNYSFTVLFGGNYSVTPSLANYSFAPQSQSFNLLTSDQTANFTGTRPYSISGQTVSGATVTLSGSQSATTTADSNGFYYFDGLATTGTYTVTPSKANYNTFIPASQTFSNLTESQIANFTGVPINDLWVSLVCSPDPNPARVGFNLDCTVKVHNDGPADVAYTLSSVLSPSVTFLSGTWIENGAECSPDGDQITCPQAGLQADGMPSSYEQGLQYNFFTEHRGHGAIYRLYFDIVRKGSASVKLN